jgi:hypothetical protein
MSRDGWGEAPPEPLNLGTEALSMPSGSNSHVTESVDRGSPAERDERVGKGKCVCDDSCRSIKVVSRGPEKDISRAAWLIASLFPNLDTAQPIANSSRLCYG